MPMRKSRTRRLSTPRIPRMSPVMARLNPRRLDADLVTLIVPNVTASSEDTAHTTINPTRIKPTALRFCLASFASVNVRYVKMLESAPARPKMKADTENPKPPWPTFSVTAPPFLLHL